MGDMAVRLRDGRRHGGGGRPTERTKAPDLKTGASTRANSALNFLSRALDKGAAQLGGTGVRGGESNNTEYLIRRP